MARYFEEYQEGEVFRSPGRTITETDVVNFSALSGDWNELHANEEFARRQYFGRRIAHGALIFSVSTGLAAQMDPSQRPDLIAFYGVDRLRFVKPVFLGDTIRLQQTVHGDGSGQVGPDIRDGPVLPGGQLKREPPANTAVDFVSCGDGAGLLSNR